MNALILMTLYVRTGEFLCKVQSTGYIMTGPRIMAALRVDIALKQISSARHKTPT